MNARLVTLGSLFLFASSVITFQSGILVHRIVPWVVAAASLAVAVGSVTLESLRDENSV